jgi:hypothetical protein
MPQLDPHQLSKIRQLAGLKYKVGYCPSWRVAIRHTREQVDSQLVQCRIIIPGNHQKPSIQAGMIKMMRFSGYAYFLGRKVLTDVNLS